MPRPFPRRHEQPPALAGWEKIAPVEDAAVPRSGGVALFDMMLAALVHGVAQLLPDTGRSEIRCVRRNQPPVEPGRPARTDLAFQIEGRKDADAGLPVAVGIIGGGAFLEILGDAPLVCVDRLDDPGTAQRLQPAHMGIDKALIVAARNAALEFDLFQMADRPIDTVFGDGGNGAVGRTLRRVRRADLDDAADPRVLDTGGVDARNMMCPAADPVHHKGQVFAHLVGEIFFHDAADDGRLGRGIVKLDVMGSRSSLAAFSTLCMLRMMSPRSPSSHKVGSMRWASSQTPGVRSVARPHLLQLTQAAQA